VHEAEVRRALGIGPEEILEERGIYPPPAGEDLAAAPTMGYRPGRGEVVLAEEWLSESELGTHFSDDPRLTAALPGGHGRVKRLDVDPRILVFEHVPPPTNSLGAVRIFGERIIVMDTRGKPAALVLPDGGHDLVIWGEGGNVRLFALRPP
jgi:hypothetical protein